MLQIRNTPTHILSYILVIFFFFFNSKMETIYLLLPMNVLSLGNFFIIALILLHEIYSRFIFCFNSRKLRLNFDHISKYESLNIKPNFQKFYPNVREGNREVNFHVIASPNVLVKIQKELFTHRKRLYGSQLSWFRILMCGCAA